MNSPALRLRTFVGATALLLTISGSIGVIPAAAQAENTAFRQAIAENAIENEALVSFYRARSYEGIWIGDAGMARRAALVQALNHAPFHGLPESRYDVQGIMDEMVDARTINELGALDVRLTELFLQYARDVQSGVLIPREVDSGIVREVSYTPPAELLAGLMSDQPAAFLRSLPPQNQEYTQLVSAKMRLIQQQAAGGWGPVVNAGKLERGATGPDVIALRNRLTAMGYMQRSLSATYDDTLAEAVRAFQVNHGLSPDGTAGPETFAEINTPITERIQSIIVAMERERWFNRDRGDRHIWVNLTDFSAKVIDFGEVTFQTRSVIGANDEDRVTPEFSDMMDHMVINPSWYVPRSIVTKEYLPQLQRNPNALQHMVLTRGGRAVNRGNIDFNKYTARSFPYAMRQPPSSRNALGLVKFMFPNKYNIYLHDTPAKSLFGRDIRAFSHGCIRLNDPFDFAQVLLAPQTNDPEQFFQSRLNSGKETYVGLENPVPVHLIYRTAFIGDEGKVSFRRDIYGRDQRIWRALSREGVIVPGVQG